MVPFPYMSLVEKIEAHSRALHAESRQIMLSAYQKANQIYDCNLSSAQNTRAHALAMRNLTAKQAARLEQIKAALLEYGYEGAAIRAARAGEIPENAFSSRLTALEERLARLERCTHEIV